VRLQREVDMNPTGNAVTAAANRFGLGARPGDLARMNDPRGWLLAQIARAPDGGALLAGLPDSVDYMREVYALVTTRRKFKQRDGGANGLGARAANPDDRNANARALKQALKPYRREFRRQLLAEAGARFRVAVTTDTPFVERLVYFWSNHFAVSVDKRPAALFAAPMEREAIRPHVTGRFAEMLVAVETHPAMLLYLDNARSVGPQSRLGRRIAMRLARKGDMAEGKAGGLNENLGREAMELHTVGVDSGYTQTDVTEFSRALTGWSVPLPRDFANGRQPGSAFLFRPNAHEPGSRRVMGKSYPEGGFEQGRAILADLARRPATARHLSLQLARHFVSDDPPRSLVDRMAKSYLDHDTDLAAVYRTMIESPEAWGGHARKFKTPQDFVISSLRAAQIDPGERPLPMLALLENMGEPPFDPRSPAGFTDNSANWIDADGLWKRVQAAEALAARTVQGGMQPIDLARSVLGANLDEDTELAIRRAESQQQAHATLFACPAFQWRV
jgi:uncharacterized protein (DUF1800 family)